MLCSKPIWRKNDYKSDSLMSFASLGCNINEKTYRKVTEAILDPTEFNEKSQLDINMFSYFLVDYLDDVILHSPDKDITIVDNKISDADKWIEIMNTLIRKEIERISEKYLSILFLTTGVDSQLLLYYMLELKKPFIAVHLQSSEEEHLFLQKQAKELGYKLEIIPLCSNEECWAHNQKLAYENPNFSAKRGALLEPYFIDAIHKIKKKYRIKGKCNLVWGIGGNLRQAAIPLYMLYDEKAITQFNHNYGKYVKHTQYDIYKPLIDKHCTDLTTYYKNFSRNYRNFQGIESHTNTSIYSPYLNDKFYYLTNHLEKTALLYHYYKLDTLTILEKVNHRVLTKHYNIFLPQDKSYPILLNLIVSWYIVYGDYKK